MAESADDPALYWIEPERRGIIPLDRFHVPSRLARTVRSDRFTRPGRPRFRRRALPAARSRCPGGRRTWINARIRTLYRKLYERGDCHTVEVYEGGELVGGLYGVSLGGAFFGESMFHRVRDASKVALVHLVARLKAGHYRLLDTQFVTDHLRTFGAVEVSRPAYHKLLDAALVGEGDFAALAVDRPVSGGEVLAASPRPDRLEARSAPIPGARTRELRPQRPWQFVCRAGAPDVSASCGLARFCRPAARR